MKTKLTLAIETAVGNGSLALFENDVLIDGWSNETKISRSHLFLPLLTEFLRKNKVKKEHLNSIAVSLGPGSFTGARVGLATATALKNGLDIECVGISVLRAVALTFATSFMTKPAGTVISAILTDRGEIHSQLSTVKDDGFETSRGLLKSEEIFSQPAKLQSFATFIEEIEAYHQPADLFLEKTLHQKIEDEFGLENLKIKARTISNIWDIGSNLSIYIGKAALNGYASDNISLIYTTNNK